MCFKMLSEETNVTILYPGGQTHMSAMAENREIQNMEIHFFSIVNNRMLTSFWQKIGHSISNYKNVKASPQCMSLMEKN